MNPLSRRSFLDTLMLASAAAPLLRAAGRAPKTILFRSVRKTLGL